MSLTGRADRIRRRGEWPGVVELTSGWARAVARPWNEDVAAVSLRLERGGARFLRACAELAGEWFPEVLSPATLPGSARVWSEAGFVPSDRLLLMEHGLGALSTPNREIESGGVEPLDELHAIDSVSFEPRWRLGRFGLTKSFTATSRSVVMRVRSGDGQCLGFAISGVALGAGYLQRLAVAPQQRGIGIGRDLVDSSLLWARRHGAMTMLVNTQIDNQGAAALYHDRGFRDVAGGLILFRYQPAAGGA